MRTVIEAKSTPMSLLSNGKILALLRPWRITVDTERMQLTISRRNWYLINHDEATYAFKSVRNVKIDRHLFGADLSIRVFSGEAKVFYIHKSKAQEIRDLLLNNDWAKNDNEILIDLN